jgi:hypothetical protein
LRKSANGLRRYQRPPPKFDDFQLARIYQRIDRRFAQPIDNLPSGWRVPAAMGVIVGNRLEIYRR